MQGLIEIKRYTRDYNTGKLTYITTLCFKSGGKRISLAKFLALTYGKYKPRFTIRRAGVFFDVKNYYWI